MVLGVYGYVVQFNLGLSATNMSNIVSWGFYISNFTFLVGVAAAAVMIILPSYIFKDKDLHKVVIIGEILAIAAIIMAIGFVVALFWLTQPASPPVRPGTDPSAVAR